MWNKMRDTAPLVSIIVLTYNSGPYILETLNSIRSQDYENIEVIICDDCSTDGTVACIKDWLEHTLTGIELQRYKLVTSTKNRGVAANCNLGLSESDGTWIKLIAGDDILLPGCIRKFVEFAGEHPDHRLFVSRLEAFQDEVRNHLYTWPAAPIPEDLESQFRLQIKGGFIKAPAVFMNKAALLEAGGFDENFPSFEDDPLWIRFLKKGYIFCYLPEILIGYRHHAASISNGKGKGYMNPGFFDSYFRFKKNIIFPLMRQKRMHLWYILANKELAVQHEIVNGRNRQDLITVRQRIILKLIAMLRKAARIAEL